MKGKQKSPGKEIDLSKSSLLDAYTDSTSSNVSRDDGKPVTKKNKNQRKREAEKLRKQSESESISNKQEETEEVIDSWEDLESNADDANIPRTIEFPASVPQSKANDESVKDLVKGVESLVVKENASANDTLTSKLDKIALTIGSIESIFSRKPSDPEVQEVKKNITSQGAVEDNQSKKLENTKSPEEIKAEREAKKKAKAASKGAAKSKDIPKEQESSQKENASNQTKSAEEIKAEREAKKKAKADAKEKAKNKDVPSESNEKIVDKAIPKKPEVIPAEESGKSKAELKAERRAKQEAQRAKKAAEAQNNEESKSKPEKLKRVPDDIQADRASVEKKLAKRLASQNILPRTKAQRKVQLFSHLHQYEREFSISSSYPMIGSHIHPSIMTLGLQFSEGIVLGSNARCVALMKALKDFIEDYTTPSSSELGRDMNDKLKPQITFLKECRPLSISMGNAIRSLKAKINSLGNELSEKDAKADLFKWIDEYVHHNVVLAAEQIAITACEKICDGDVILTYGW